ncbi:MAG: acyl-CoA dehydrogenase family protein, partial [Thermomicrobiales bacterium]
TGSHDVVFENVFVPAEARLPDSANPPGRATSGWNLLGSAVYLGIAEAARDFTVRYARERRPTAVGGPIAEIPSVQHRVARMEILLFQARAALYAAAETHATYPEHREALGWQLAAAKYTVTNHAIAVTDMALRVVGSSGLQKQYSLERYFRDVRAGLGNPPIDDVALTLIGKAALGL